jgi:hypothetical protein
MIPSFSTSKLRTGAKKLLAEVTNQYLQFLSPHNLLSGGYKRIYCYHIRKTGGTSLNRAFLSLAGEPHETVYNRLFEGLNYYARSGNLTFVSHNKYLIEAGHYFYGFSHLPAHELSLPPDTFTITILRDPVKRVISHYKMLVYLSSNGIDHPCLETEGPWLGDGFGDFISNMPEKHLLRQLYMFSSTFDVAEAADLIRRCNYFFLTDEFQTGLKTLSKKLDLNLPHLHAKKSSVEIPITDIQRMRLREILDAEYRLLNKISSDVHS